MRTLITGVVLVGLLGGVMVLDAQAKDSQSGNNGGKDRIRGREDAGSDKNQALLKSLPPEYRHPAQVLELTAKQLTKIAQKHENYQLALKRDEEQFRERYQKLQDELEQARKQRKRSEMQRLHQKTWELATAQSAQKQRRYIELQKSVMQELTANQKRQWPALLMAGEAMIRFRWVMTKEQVKEVDAICLRKADKISQIKDLDEKDRMKRQLERRIYSEILTMEQRKKLAAPRSKSDSEGKKPADKSEDDKNSKPADKNAPPGPGGW